MAVDPEVEHWLADQKLSQQPPFLFSFPQRKSMDSDRGPGSSSMSVASLSLRASRFSWLWGPDGRALADVLLRIRPLPSSKGESAEELREKQQEPSEEDVELQLHSSVLASQSHHFRQRLICKTADSAQPLPSSVPQLKASKEDGGSMRVMEERIAASEIEAACSVLRFCYTEEVLYDSPSQLVTILKIADKWKAIDCVDACRSAFAQLKPEEIDLDVIKRVYSLEGIVNDVANFAELLAMVQSRLVVMFKDVVEVIRNPTLQAQMLQLPFAAMLALLRSDQLVVDCENSVVVVANLWVMRGRGRFTTPEQRRFLAGCIRLGSLTPSYLCGVLPNLKWFTWPTACPAPFYAILQARMVSPEARQVLIANSASAATSTPSPVSTPTPSASATPGAPSAGQQQQQGGKQAEEALIRRSLAGSDAGKAPALASGPAAARRATTSSVSSGIGGASNALALGPEGVKRVVRDQNLELVCDIEHARLTQYLTDGLAALRAHPEGFKGIHVHSECSYFRGFLWGIKVVFGYSAGGDAPFVVTPSVFASPPPGEEGVLPLATPITVSFRCTLDAIGSYGSPYATATFPGASFMRPGDENVSSIGIANFFKKVAKQSDPEAWRPFMYGGKLRLKLSVVGATVE